MFIRTKNGIYKVTNDKYGVIEENGVFKIHCENMGHHWYSELDVIAKSDNLAELIDCYVVEHTRLNVKPVVFELDTNLNAFKNNLFTIYGAVWTSKGLIYVAKMNSEGVLCLI